MGQNARENDNLHKTGRWRGNIKQNKLVDAAQHLFLFLTSYRGYVTLLISLTTYSHKILKWMPFVTKLSKISTFQQKTHYIKKKINNKIRHVHQRHLCRASGIQLLLTSFQKQTHGMQKQEKMKKKDKRQKDTMKKNYVRNIN